MAEDPRPGRDLPPPADPWAVAGPPHTPAHGLPPAADRPTPTATHGTAPGPAHSAAAAWASPPAAAGPKAPARSTSASGAAPGAAADRPALQFASAPPPPSFHRGRAAVGAGQAPPFQTTAEYPPDLRAHAERVLGPDRPARPPRAVRRAQLRRGGGWTWIGGTFAFVCWGVWAISTRGGDVTTPALGLVVLIAVAAGVFGLARLLGAVLLERTLGRTRRGAWGAHLATGVFCTASGVAYLAQTQWLVEAWQFVRGL